MTRLRGFDAGDLTQRGDESPPLLALRLEDALPRVGDAVVAASALPGPLHPAPANQPALFEAIERGVERSEREAERAVRPLFDLAGDVVAVQRLFVDEREDQQIGAAFLCRIDRRAIDEAFTI